MQQINRPARTIINRHLRAGAAYLICLVCMLFAPQTGWAAQTIRIGLVAPLTGQFSLFGKLMESGAKFAVNNPYQLRPETRLELIIANDECNASKAKAVANQLVGKNVHLVVGHFCTLASVAAAPIYRQARIVQISPASTLARFTENENISTVGTYRLATRAQALGDDVVSFLRRFYWSEKLALVHDGTALGREITDQITKALQIKDRSPSITSELQPGLIDYAIMAKELVQSDIGVVFLTANHIDSANFARSIRNISTSIIISGPDTLNTEEFAEQAKRASEGVYFLAPFDAGLAPGSANLAQDMIAQDVQPYGIVVDTVSAIDAYLSATQLAHSREFDAVVDAFRKPLSTRATTVNFDEHGNVIRPQFQLWQWRAGKPRLID